MRINISLLLGYGQTPAGSNYNAHTDPLFKKLRLVKLADLFTLNVLKMYYKFKHARLPSYVENMVGVRRSGRRVRSPSGDYSTANDAWKSNVHKRCHASPWRRIVASWRLVIVTSYMRCAGNGQCCPGDHQEFGGIFVAKRYQIFGTAVSERPGHFLISWLGAVGSRWTLNREKVGI